MIIGINGKIGHGKDTVALLIQYLTSEAYKKGRSFEQFKERYQSPNTTIYDSDWIVKKYADKLKQIASILTGIPKEKFEDQDFKKTNLGSEWGYNIPLQITETKTNTVIYSVDHTRTQIKEMTVREFLQKLGTDAIRQGLHDQAWVNALFSDYTEEKVGSGPLSYIEYPKWIISDLRFSNEYSAIKERNGIVIRVERPSIGQTSNHISETALDDYTFDKVIVNDGSIDDLREKVKDLIKEFNL